MTQSTPTDSTQTPTHTAGTRPIGFLATPEGDASRALAALAEGRTEDADRHIRTMPHATPVDRAWKLLVAGVAAGRTGRLAESEPLLLQAVSHAMIGAWAAVTEPEKVAVTAADPSAVRLAARALNRLGWTYRRQERGEDALRSHLAAYRLRVGFGSFEEQWETAVELSLDTDVLRRYDDARRWCRRALDAASSADQEPDAKRGVALTNLGTICLEAGDHEAAIAAARQARQAWHDHDAGAITAAQADARLGTALLKRGEALRDAGDHAADVLAEATQWLKTAGDALAAFGDPAATDAAACRQQLDFAERLRAT